MSFGKLMQIDTQQIILTVVNCCCWHGDTSHVCWLWMVLLTMHGRRAAVVLVVVMCLCSYSGRKYIGVGGWRVIVSVLWACKLFGGL